MNLENKYLEIWQLAIPLLKKGRFYDVMHTADVIQYMQEILKGEKREKLSPTLIPAIILHDIGWSKIEDLKKKNTKWDQQELRVQHMKEGASLAQEILEKVKYNKSLIKEITDLIATHDNIYLGIEPQTENEKILRDADACYILTHDSFWKDYQVKGNDMSPIKYLEKHTKNHGKRYTNTAQKITDQEVLERNKELMDKTKSPESRFKEIKNKAAKARKNPDILT